MPLFAEGPARVAARLGSTPLAPLTGIGVQALAEPDLLVEVAAIGILDEHDRPSRTGSSAGISP